MAIALEGLNALLQMMTAVMVDWWTRQTCETASRESMQARCKQALDEVVSKRPAVVAEGLPPRRRCSRGFPRLLLAPPRQSRPPITKLLSWRPRMHEAEADQFGAILLYQDPSVSDAPIFEGLPTPKMRTPPGT